MISIIVERAPADRQAPDITNALLATLPPALELGRVELDKYSLQYPIRLECRYLPAARCGMLAEILDVSLGEVWRGKVSSVEHVAITGGAVTNLEVVRPDD